MTAARARRAPPEPDIVPPWITLLTDFGPRDTYIGMMKGVIATIAPRAVVVDLSHGVAPQDIVDGAYLLATSYRYFPAGTIHVAVVDPGVGGTRAILAMEFGGFRFLAPDNGLLGGVLGGKAPDRLVEVKNTRYFLPRVAATFHGRDIFAPVAAHMALGAKLDELGPARAEMPKQPWPEASAVPGGVRGEVIYRDHFGNCITNIRLDENAAGTARVAGKDLPLSSHYAQAARGELVALRGSSGYLELAVREGSASERFGLDRGAGILWIPAARSG
ncbi:MAG: SAM-dependent chlorinase/fluorinase [Planctomycetes bacterium]|nr:SAM-dependent chlorinase/fluorinase [Planctomycetota bacterium]